MTDQELMKHHGWKSVCDKDCYSPWKHSHEIDEMKDFEKKCCDVYVKFDAQCYQYDPFNNKRILLNCYECKKCGAKTGHDIKLN